MTYNTTQTSTEYGNTGLQQFAGNVGKWKYLLLVSKGTSIATKTPALLKATYVDNINEAVGDRWYLLPLIWNGEPTQEDNVKESSDFGFETEVRKGKLNYKITLEEMSVYNKNKLNKLDGKAFDCYIITDKDFILGYSIDGVEFLAKELDYFSVLPETQNTGSTNAHVMLELRFSDTRQQNEFEVALNPYDDEDVVTAWRPSLELSGIKDLRIEVTAMTQTTATISLKGYDGVAYSAAVAGDVYMRKTTIDGVAITVSSLTETATSGIYTAGFSSQTEGTFYFSLYDQPTAVTQGVETPVYDTYALVVAS